MPVRALEVGAAALGRGIDVPRPAALVGDDGQLQGRGDVGDKGGIGGDGVEAVADGAVGRCYLSGYALGVGCLREDQLGEGRFWGTGSGHWTYFGEGARCETGCIRSWDFVL